MPLEPSASTAVVAAGVLVALALLLTTRSVTLALPTLLEFLLAASLLRLSADQDWRSIAGAATIAAVRHLVGAGIRAARRTRVTATAAAGSPAG